MLRIPEITPLLMLCSACGGGDGGAADTIDFATGEFTVQTHIVDDRCLDGGLNLLFMPEGVDTPWEWPFPITIHAEKDLPITYDIELRQPFGQMTMTATDSGVNQQLLVSETNVGVLLGEAQFGNCAADIDATVQMRIERSDSGSGLGDLTLSNPRSDDGRCPPEMPPSCQVLLSFEAQRR